MQQRRNLLPFLRNCKCVNRRSCNNSHEVKSQMRSLRLLAFKKSVNFFRVAFHFHTAACNKRFDVDENENADDYNEYVYYNSDNPNIMRLQRTWSLKYTSLPSSPHLSQSMKKQHIFHQYKRGGIHRSLDRRFD